MPVDRGDDDDVVVFGDGCRSGTDDSTIVVIRASTIKPENDHAEPLTSTTTNNTITKASTTTRKKKELKKKKRADSYHNWGI